MGILMLTIGLWGWQVSRKSKSRNSLSIAITLHLLLIISSALLSLVGRQPFIFILFTAIIPLVVWGVGYLNGKNNYITKPTKNNLQQENEADSEEQLKKIEYIQKRISDLSKQRQLLHNNLKAIQGQQKHLRKSSTKKRLPHIQGNLKRLQILQQQFDELYDSYKHLAEANMQATHQYPRTVVSFQNFHEVIEEQKTLIELLQKERQVCQDALLKLNPTAINAVPSHKNQPTKKIKLKSRKAIQQLDKQVNSLWHSFDPHQQEGFWKAYYNLRSHLQQSNDHTSP
jgi:Ca2+/Na+ antiporter